MIVCLICDVTKPDARAPHGRDYCDGCGRATPNREVAPDHHLIAPGSTLRFKDQRKLYRSERKT